MYAIFKINFYLIRKTFIIRLKILKTLLILKRSVNLIFLLNEKATRQNLYIIKKTFTLLININNNNKKFKFLLF